MFADNDLRAAELARNDLHWRPTYDRRELQPLIAVELVTHQVVLTLDYLT